MKTEIERTTSRRSSSSGGLVPGGAQRGASATTASRCSRKRSKTEAGASTRIAAPGLMQKTLRSFAGADIVLGPHGAGLANALLARRGLVWSKVHGDFGAELDLFRKVADGRAGGYVSVKGRFSGAGGMTFTAEDASSIASCAVNVWLDGRNSARGERHGDDIFRATLEACGRVGPDPSSPKLFVGSRKRGGSGGALIEGAAVVGHDVDCSSPGKPAPSRRLPRGG